MIIRIYATESGSAWGTRTLIWRSDRVDTTHDGQYYPIIYDCSCSSEMGKIGSLKFVVGPDHPYYNNFRKAKTILTVLVDATNAGDDGGNCLFRGAVSEISVDIYQQATITANDALEYLEHSLHVPTGKSDQKKTRREWFRTAIQDHNSQMSDDPEKIFVIDESSNIVDYFEGNITEEKKISDTSYSDNMSFIKSNVLDECAGYLQVRYNANFTKQYLNLVELRSYGHTAQQKLKFAVNIEEISHDDLSDDIYTVLVPVGKDAKTIEGVGGSSTRTAKCQDMDGTWRDVSVTIDGKYMKIQEAIDLYGYIYEPVSFSDKSSKEDIVTEALNHIKTTYHPDNFSLKVKALDMHYLDDNTPFIHLGDKVTVIRHSKTVNNQLIERKVTAICTAINYDLTSPENTEFTVGTSFDTLTGSSSGGGSSSSSSSGYGGSIHDCIGYMLGDMAVIDHEVTQINGGLLEVNTSITNINSELITLAGRVTITYDYMTSTYADNTSLINWVYNNVESIYAAGQMYEQWLEFTGSTVFQTMDQWGSFVGLWYATYDANGNFLGYVFRNGGGLFIQQNDTRFGIFHEGNIGGGMTVHFNEATGLYEVRINGDWVDIDANRRLTAVVGQIDEDHSWLGMYKNRAELLVNTLVDYDEYGNPIFDSSGIHIDPDQVSVGLYTHDGFGGLELTAGLMVQMINDESTALLAADHILLSGNKTLGAFVGDNGLLINENNLSFGVYTTGEDGSQELTAGLMVQKINDETTTLIRGNRVDIRGNTEASVLIDHFLDENNHFTTAGLVINQNNLSFGVYTTHSGEDSAELTAGIIVGKINGDDGADVYIKGTKIKIGDENAETVISGKLSVNQFTAANIEAKFLDAGYVKLSHGLSLNGNDITSVGSINLVTNNTSSGNIYANSVSVYRSLYLGHDMFIVNVLNPSNSVLDAVNLFTDSSHPISYSGTTITIPYRTLRGDWKELTFNHVTSVTGKWSGNKYTVTAGGNDSLPISTTIDMRYGYTDSTGTWYTNGWTKRSDNNQYITYAQVRNGENQVAILEINANTVYTNGLKAAEVSGEWTSGSTETAKFSYWNTSAKSASIKSTTAALRYGSTESGTWYTGRWRQRSDNGQYVTDVQLRNNETQVAILEVNANTVYTNGLRAAKVNGRWSGLTFYYWNTSVGDNASTNKLTTVTLKYGWRDSSGWHNSQWTTESGAQVTYVGAYNGNDILSETLKITAPTRGLYVDTTNHKITLSTQSTTESLDVSATATITYDSSTHKYTAKGTAVVGGTSLSSSSKTGGVEAYNAGIDAGKARIDLTNAGESTNSASIDLPKYGTVYKINANYLLSDGTKSNGVVSLYVKTPSDRYDTGLTTGYISGWSAAQGKLGWPASTTTATYATFSYPSTSSGVGVKRYYYATVASSETTAGGVTTVTVTGRIRDGSATGNTVALNTLTFSYSTYAAGVTAGQTTGYISGWSAAQGKLGWPASTTTATYATFSYPSTSSGVGVKRYYYATVASSATTTSGVTTVTVTGRIRDGSATGNTVALNTLTFSYSTYAAGVTAGQTTGYISGWSAAQGKLGWPASTTTATYATFSYPSTSSGVGVKRYYYATVASSATTTSGVTTVTVTGRIRDGSATGNTVALKTLTFSYSTYNAGWAAARNLVDWPATGVTLSSKNATFAVFKYPAGTVGSSTSKSYHLTLNAGSPATSNGVTTVKVTARMRNNSTGGGVVAIDQVSVSYPAVAAVDSVGITAGGGLASDTAVRTSQTITATAKDSGGNTLKTGTAAWALKKQTVTPAGTSTQLKFVTLTVGATVVGRIQI